MIDSGRKSSTVPKASSFLGMRCNRICLSVWGQSVVVSMHWNKRSKIFKATVGIALSAVGGQQSSPAAESDLNCLMHRASSSSSHGI
eukprot:5522036-Amphidinium_carterae.1